VRKKIKNNLWVIISFLVIIFLTSVSLQNKKFLSLSFSKSRDIPLLSQVDKNQSLNKSVLKIGAKNNARFDPRLKLLGTIVGNPSLAYVFNLASNKNEFYRVDDMINDVQLVGIGSGKILLSKLGVTQELALGREGARFENPYIAEEKSRDNEIVISKSFVFEEVKRANEILRTVKILPIPDEGPTNRLKGFRIDNVPGGSIFDKAGLKSGDVICFIQGQRLESALEAVRIFHTVQNQPEVKVDLMRNNEMLTLRYKIRN
jgi:general secretion pathway protein C